MNCCKHRKKLKFFFAAGREFTWKKAKQNDENQSFKDEKIEESEKEKAIKKEDETVSKKLVSSEDTNEPTSCALKFWDFFLLFSCNLQSTDAFQDLTPQMLLSAQYSHERKL